MKLSLRARTQPEVNLTSLIDVVFLLLIFFMVSTSFVKQSQIKINLPQADISVTVEEPAEQIDIMIMSTGTFLVNGRELINNRPETIRNALQKVSGGDSNLPLTISADANARHLGLFITAFCIFILREHIHARHHFVIEPKHII